MALWKLELLKRLVKGSKGRGTPQEGGDDVAVEDPPEDEGEDEGEPGDDERDGPEGEGDGEPGDEGEDDGEGEGDDEGDDAEDGDGEDDGDDEPDDETKGESDRPVNGKGGSGGTWNGEVEQQTPNHNVEDFAKLDEIPEEQMVKVEPTLKAPEGRNDDDGLVDVGTCSLNKIALGESDYSGDVASQIIQHARVAGVRTQLRRLLERTDHTGEERGLRRGKLVSSLLARTAVGDANVFSRRWEQEGEDAAVSIIVDMSGSMSTHASKAGSVTGSNDEHSKLGVAVKTALIMAESLSQTHGVHVEVLGFPSYANRETVENASTGMSHSDVARDLYAEAGGSMYRVRSGIGLCVLKTFGERMNVMRRRVVSAMGYANGGTPDLEALDGAARSLLKVQAEKRIIFMICDGEGAPTKLFRPHVDMLYSKYRILTIGMGIGCEPSTFVHRFKYATTVQSATRLAEDCLTTVVNAIVKDRA